MTDIDSTEIPMLSEDKANAILDDIADSTLRFATPDGEEVEMSATQRMQRAFGDAAPLVARLIMLGAMRGFDLGLVEATPGSDRTDILAAELRRVHAKEQFGDCVEDGERYPCQTVRMLDLVTGTVIDEAELQALAEGDSAA